MAEAAVWLYGLGIAVFILIAGSYCGFTEKKKATLILVFNLLPKL